MIVDTSFVIDLMRDDRGAKLKLEELGKKGEPLLTTSLTIFELYRGIGRSRKPEKERMKITAILKNQIVADFDEIAAQRAGELDDLLMLRGRPIGALDCMIAGIALVRMEKLLTRNISEFEKVKGLGLETY